jgi:hypothetical protein
MAYAYLSAGRIHTKPLRDYIKKNKEDARDLGTVKLANGDVVRHIQFTIQKRNYGVLRDHTTAGLDIWNFDSMLLNIYVMPEKGYVVRRIDECLPDGTVKIRYDSLDFVDHGNGIFFPKVFMSITVWGDTKYPIVRKYEILEATLLNEKIPNKYLDRPLVKGTRIVDWRDSVVEEDEDGGTYARRFVTTRDGFASELDVLYEEWKKSLEVKEQPEDEIPVIDSKIAEQGGGNISFRRLPLRTLLRSLR